MTMQDNLAQVFQLLRGGAYQAAESAARVILNDDPQQPQAALLAGLAVAAMGETARAAPILVAVANANTEAEHPCRELARFDPPFPPGLVRRQFAACLLLAPNDQRLRLAYAEFLIDRDQPGEALKILMEAEDTAASAHLKGLALAERAQFAAAEDAFRHAVTLAPGGAASWSNLGMMLKIEGRFAEAAQAHDQALALAPADPRLRVNRAVTHLCAGEWQKAWPDYGYRLDLPGAPALDPSRLLPALQPGDSLSGMTVLAVHEDGFGDTFQFCRYLPMLAERGARVIACVPAEAAPIIRGIPGVQQVVTQPGQAPAHDFICPMFSLPGVFRTTPATIPPSPTLVIDPELRQRWLYRLPTGPRLRVGLAWAGQARPAMPGFASVDRRRSAGLAAFEPLFHVPGTWIISLQKGPPAAQTRPPSLTLFDPMPLARDFADTAAIISNLDLVVSVDTSVVHLAGLVGTPVFLLDRYDHCWRWLHGRRDSPWYPKLTIFRQHRPDDWSDAMAQAAASLDALAKFRGTQPAPNGLHEPGPVRAA